MIERLMYLQRRFRKLLPILRSLSGAEGGFRPLHIDEMNITSGNVPGTQVRNVLWRKVSCDLRPTCRAYSAVLFGGSRRIFCGALQPQDESYASQLLITDLKDVSGVTLRLRVSSITHAEIVC